MIDVPDAIVPPVVALSRVTVVALVTVAVVFDWNLAEPLTTLPVGIATVDAKVSVVAPLLVIADVATTAEGFCVIT